MGDVEIPIWLKGLPLAPEYRPTETEFADPIAYISRIEKEASAFGICKVVPPLPRPSKKYVLSNLKKSLSKCPELGSGAPACSPSQMGSGEKGNDDEVRAAFTTRHQELGHGVKRLRGPVPIQMQVWQSGEAYTLEQFESKSKVFARSHLNGLKDVSPLVIESLFWKAASEKPIYVEYANDVPGSGFGEPEDPFRYFHRRKRRRRLDQKHQESIGCEKKQSGYTEDVSSNSNASLPSSSNLSSEDGLRPSSQKSLNLGSTEREGTSGWKISNSPWNLQVIARARGSLTRFMPDDIPGVTSPMIYIGMMFSWFAWHVEDHELHSLNFLHMGAPKTWYGVPGDYAFALEEIIRVQGYGGHLDRLGALTLLGEKTSLLSPQTVTASGIPCCRLVQNPGEFVVTFPRAYHIGFSHGFNCGEAANFATPQWLKVAKEAAVRRAAMNFLPMLSHQQLLYMLTMSFVSRVPTALLPGVRSSRLRDRKKEEREILVKKAFIDDVVNENHLLGVLLGKDSTFRAVLWDPDLLPSPSNGSMSACFGGPLEANGFSIGERNKADGSCLRNECDVMTGNVAETSGGNAHFVDVQNQDIPISEVNGTTVDMEAMGYLYEDDDDLPCGMRVDSGTLACVACGILGFPFMSVVQPSDGASKEMFPEELRSVNPPTPSCVDNMLRYLDSGSMKEAGVDGGSRVDQAKCMGHIPVTEVPNDGKSFMSSNNVVLESSSSTNSLLSEIVADKEQEEVHVIRWQIGSSSVEHEFDELGPTVGAAKPKVMGYINTSNAIHLSNGSGESGGSMPMEIDPIVEEDLKSKNILDAEASKGTKQSSSTTATEGGEKVNRQWNTSNKFLRPRIFCLEHALEIQELLQSKGGVNVLIICHSDYPKIKGEAMSIAEEIGAHFNCKELPLETASQSDLDLIYISIDDEHEECSEDWTTKLGLNLRHLVKLRKQHPLKQERPALALGGLFSDHVPASEASSLRWHSRKSRTHHKPTGLCRSRPCHVTEIKKDDMVGRDSDAEVVPENQGDKHSRSPDNEDGAPARTCRSQGGHGSPRKHHPTKESTSSAQAPMTKSKRDEGNNNSGSDSGEEYSVHKKPENVKAELAGLPILNDPTSRTDETQEKIWNANTQENNTTLDTSDPTMSVDIPTLVEISGCCPGGTNMDGEVCDSATSVDPSAVAMGMVGSEALHQEYQAIEETSMVSDVCNSAMSLLAAIDVPTVGHSEMQQEIKATVENTTVSEHSKFGKLGGQPTEISVTCKARQTTEGTAKGCRASGSAELQFQPSVSVSVIDCSEVQREEIKTTETDVAVDPASLEGRPTIGISAVESTKKDQPNETATVLCGIDDPAELAGQATAISRANNSEVNNGTDIFNSANSAVLTTVAFSTVESSGMQQEKLITTAEIATVHCVCDSGKPAGLSSISTTAIGNSGILQGNQTMDEMNPPAGFYSLKDGMERRNANPILVYSRAARKENKRKREVEEKTYVQDNWDNGFIRSPCEGLRPRTGRNLERGMDVISCQTRKVKNVEKKAQKMARDKKSYPCDLDGCRMSFATKAELLVHKRNRCTHEGCGKRFSSHRYVMHHERVHSEERPLKCPWKGCGMSFKWAWARTEHVRLHTGERPYQCSASGCGLTFRFVSDFSRHRRKTGHSVN